MNDKKKFGLFSIVLLGINGVIGSGIFLLPGKAMKIMGPGSLWAYVFDMFLVLSMALCFAETAGMFEKNGGPYIYAKEAFGNFVGFEVGIMKWAISIIAWATMAVAFATALSAIWPQAAVGATKNIVAVSILVGLGIINILGVQIAKYMNNIITVGKLIPLILFAAIGIFFIKGSNFTPIFPHGASGSTFGAAAILIFYAFTGFESIAVAAEDMENPQKNIPIAIIITMCLASVIYIMTQAVAIGTLGPNLAKSVTPVADSAKTFLGSFGGTLVTAGTLISIGGINIAASFITPRSGVALAENGLMPNIVAKNSRFGTPYISIIITVVLASLIALTGSFTQLAAISVVSRFAQYIPTCLAVIVLRKKRPDLKSTFRVPFGPVLPTLSVLASIWLLSKATKIQIIWGLGALLIGVPLYFIMKHLDSNKINKTQTM
ncbi:APC family permease [Clostridium estertheticum]|uniref:APC family permease n=1 Tax=Clostridium estertheticum TaxID=238834 RepID=UPI001C0CA495|nr:APC family permease [Clostridium estertheticum]MBU3176901.1 APC family permease [Clostridium estertheticum]